MWWMLAGMVLVAGQVDSGYVGRVDTVGATTYDWWFNGPVHRDIVNAPGYGIHIVWMYSAELSGTSFPDRNMRYDFFDYATSAWNWIDPDFMQSGVNVFPERAGYGNIGADPATGAAIICGHGGSPIHPIIARDIAPDAGIFEYAEGTPIADGYQWPVIAVGQNGIIHVLGMTAAYGLGYTRIVTWPTFDSLIGGFGPTSFPTYNIAASKVSPKVYVCWTDNGTPVERAYSRLSEDGGTTWGPVTELIAPPAYGGDTVTSFHITSLFPFYDMQDRLHVAANVIPVVHDTGYIMPAEVWHWCPDNSPAWSEIHRAGCAPENMLGGVGYNAAFACRPSMGEDATGNLYVTWEQFDSANVEPLTGFLRAGVWMAVSPDNGATWNPGMRLTPENTASHRFPCIVDWIGSDGPVVLYLMDPIAGFFVQGEHEGVECPVICQWTAASGIQDEPATNPGTTFRIWPNPASQKLHIAGGQRLVLLDVAGRERMKLHDGTNDIAALPPGIYVVRDELTRLSRKLVVRP